MVRCRPKDHSPTVRRVRTTTVGPVFARRATGRNLLLLLLLSTLWGSSYTFIKLGVATIPPITLITARTLIAGCVLAGILLLRRVRLPRSATIWARFLVQALLNSAVPFTLIAWAETRTDANLATILNSLSPIFAFLLTAVLSQHESVTGRKLFGVGTGLIGVGVIVGTGALSGLGHQLAGQLAIVAASICYAGAAVFGKGFADLDPMLPAAGSLLCGAVTLMPLSVAVDRPWTIRPTSESVLALLALALLSTAVTFVIYFRLVASLGSVGTTAQAYLRVPIGVAISTFTLGEQLTPTTLIGLGCVVIGVIAMTIPSHHRQRTPHPRCRRCVASKPTRRGLDGLGPRAGSARSWCS
jgi:drug/metabolite transporter (DMT)-like permease